ncbi:MAG: hypothetical protein KC684_02215 [Candidatus Omnitrophica bacterium]|nr:hypothetical protein [Candidatus Omnitrophota bacterium]
MNKIRHLDNVTARWIMKHFYLLFFQIVLFIIFLFWFVNMFGVIDVATDSSNNLTEKALAAQSVNTTIIVFLLLLNSFWMLYMFSYVQRIFGILKDLNFNVNRLRFDNRKK